MFVDEISSVFEDGGVGVLGSLNDLVFVAELGVTVVLDPRRLPLRRIRSLESCVGGMNVNGCSRVGFVFVERISDLYLKSNMNFITFYIILSLSRLFDYRGGAQFCSVVFNNAPTYVLPKGESRSLIIAIFIISSLTSPSDIHNEYT